MIKRSKEEMQKNQMIPGGLTMGDLGIQYSIKDKVFTVPLTRINMIFAFQSKKRMYLPFIVNKIPLWYISKDEQYNYIAPDEHYIIYNNY